MSWDITPLYFFWLKFYILSTKGIHQSKTSVKCHMSRRKSEILHFYGLLLFKSYKVSGKNSTKELSLMTIKSDAKFKEKLTCGFKYDMTNLVYFHPTTQKSENFFLIGSFFQSKHKVWATKIPRTYISWHWTVMKNLNKPWPCGFKNHMRNWVNFQ